MYKIINQQIKVIAILLLSFYLQAHDISPNGNFSKPQDYSINIYRVTQRGDSANPYNILCINIYHTHTACTFIVVIQYYC